MVHDYPSKTSRNFRDPPGCSSRVTKKLIKSKQTKRRLSPSGPKLLEEHASDNYKKEHEADLVSRKLEALEIMG
jgi:hypothetical protein